MDKLKIMLAEDDPEIRELVQNYLIKEGYQIDTVPDGEKALTLFQDNDYHLILLDIMLPEIDGIEICKIIRKSSNVPIIMITAKDSEVDKVLGLGVGADDYITKPFLMRVLLARIKAQLRRFMELGSKAVRHSNKLINTGPFHVDIDGYLVKKEDQVIKLTATEFELFKLLLLNPGKVFTKKQIFNSIWGEDYLEADNNIMVHIRRLRTKIENDSKNPQFIKTVWGIGYKYECENYEI